MAKWQYKLTYGKHLFVGFVNASTEQEARETIEKEHSLELTIRPVDALLNDGWKVD
jgi:hypothetical protein